MLQGNQSFNHGPMEMSAPEQLKAVHRPCVHWITASALTTFLLKVTRLSLTFFCAALTGTATRRNVFIAGRVELNSSYVDKYQMVNNSVKQLLGFSGRMVTSSHLTLHKQQNQE